MWQSLRPWMPSGPRAVTAIIQDQRKGRRGEWEWIAGLVAAEGERMGVPTPLNSAVLELYRKIEAGMVGIGPHNLGQLSQIVSKFLRVNN